MGSPGAIWAEWTSAGPLLIYITVTIIDKPSLTATDWFLIITFYVCLITGFLIIPQQPVGLEQFWLFISCITYVPCLFLPWYSKNSAFNFKREQPLAADGDFTEVVGDRYTQQQNLAMWLTIIMPLFTVNYLAATWGGIDVPTTIVIYQLLSVCTKALFSAATMDAHLDLIRDAESRLIEHENRVNAARRAFMRWGSVSSNNCISNFPLQVHFSRNAHAAEQPHRWDQLPSNEQNDGRS